MVWSNPVTETSRAFLPAKQATATTSTSLMFQRQVSSTDGVISIFPSYLSIHPFIDDSVVSLGLLLYNIWLSWWSFKAKQETYIAFHKKKSCEFRGLAPEVQKYSWLINQRNKQRFLLHGLLSSAIYPLWMLRENRGRKL